jgi:hypothetical protein
MGAMTYHDRKANKLSDCRDRVISQPLAEVA